MNVFNKLVISLTILMVYNISSMNITTSSMWDHLNYSDILITKLNLAQLFASKKKIKNVGDIACCSVSEDGKLLAVGTTTQKVFLYDIVTKRLEFFAQLPKPLTALSISKSKVCFAFGFKDGTICVFNRKRQASYNYSSEILKTTNYPIVRLSIESNKLLYAFNNNDAKICSYGIYENGTGSGNIINMDESINRGKNNLFLSEDKSLSLSCYNDKIHDNKANPTCTLGIALCLSQPFKIKEKHMVNQAIEPICATLSKNGQTLVIGGKQGKVLIYESHGSSLFKKVGSAQDFISMLKHSFSDIEVVF